MTVVDGKMRNAFFDMAMRKAASLNGNRKRLVLLLAQLGSKIRDVNWRNVSLRTAREKFSVLGRLVKAYSNGTYRQISWKTMLLVVAAIIYFVTPIDMLPDFIPVTGLTDDVGILLWVYNNLGSEIEKFLQWEKTNLVNENSAARG